MPALTLGSPSARDVPRLPDPLDLEALYDRYAATVAHWAARLGGPLFEVDDVVQEVFIVAHRRLSELRDPSKVGTWLYRTTANVVRQRRKRERWRRWLRGLPGEFADALPTQGPTPAQALESAQAAHAVYGLLDALDEKYRTVLILFQMEGLSGEEIARLTGTKLPTVWVRLKRAREMFLKRLERLEARAKVEVNR